MPHSGFINRKSLNLGIISVTGLHLEGPFINKEKCGAHPPEYILPLASGTDDFEATYGTLEDVSIVTLAPELGGSAEIIKYLVNRGIKVSLGKLCGPRGILVSHFMHVMSELL